MTVFGGQLSSGVAYEDFVIFADLEPKLIPFDGLVVNSDESVPKRVFCSSTICDANLYLFGGTEKEAFTSEKNENQLIHGNNEITLVFNKFGKELSSDLIMLIFSFLTRYDLVRVSTVCTLFHKCATSNFIWKPRYEDYYAVEPREGGAMKRFGEKQLLDRNWFQQKPAMFPLDVKQSVSLLKFQKSNVFSDGTGVLALAMATGEVNLYNILPDGELKPTSVLDFRKDPSFCINFHPSRMGTTIVSSGAQSDVTICDMETGRLIAEWNTKQRIVWNVSILDSSCIATCGEESTIKLWDIHTQKLIHKFSDGNTHFYPFYDCATNDKTPTSAIVIAASQDKSAKVFDRRSGKCEGVMKTASGNFEVNLFNDYQITVGGLSLISLFDLRKCDQLVDSIQLFQDVESSTPVRGLSVNNTRTICGSRKEINILSRHPDIHKQNKIEPDNKYHVINKLDCKDILTLYSDDEYLITGGRGGVLVHDFTRPISPIVEKKPPKQNKNCTIQ